MGEGRELWEALPRKPCSVGKLAYISEQRAYCGGLNKDDINKAWGLWPNFENDAFLSTTCVEGDEVVREE